MPAAVAIPIIAAAIGGGAAIAGGVIASRANKRATDKNLEYQDRADAIGQRSEDRAIDFQREQLDYDRWLASATAGARQPYLDALAGALGTAPGAGGASFNPGTYEAAQPFVAPDPNAVTNTPAFQFRLKEGQQALERSASARGTLLTGGTLRDALSYGQEMGSQEYDKEYGRSFSEYQLNEGNRAAAFDRNANLGYQQASLQNQSASLANQSWQARIQAILSMAGLAGPGQYPGYAGNRKPTDPNLPPGNGDGTGSLSRGQRMVAAPSLLPEEEQARRPYAGGGGLRYA